MQDCQSNTVDPKKWNTVLYDQTVSTNLSVSPGGMDESSRGDQRSLRQIMYDRWHRSNLCSIPQIDLKDIMEQGHYKMTEKACPLDEMR